ncbi:MAG: response regulator, partial [Elusimicrobiota bacterium]
MKKIILIVDDDHSIVEFLTDCLKSEGYEVSSAFDGKRGCDEAKRIKPDLIILDLLMPDMHGFEVCRTLRQDQALQAVKIMISSGKSYAVDKKAALGLGADSYLVKPYSASQLIDAVRSLIGESKNGSPEAPAA